jgi:hypothetical protein
MNGGMPPPGTTRQPPGTNLTPKLWLLQLRLALSELSPEALSTAEAALREYPTDSALLVYGALAALHAGQPDRAAGFLKRFERRYESDRAVLLLQGLVLAQQGHAAHAATLLEQDGLLDFREATRWFIGDRTMGGWLVSQLKAIREAHFGRQRAARTEAKRVTAAKAVPKAAAKTAAKPAPRAAKPKAAPQPAAAPPPSVPDLPRLEVELDTAFAFADPEAIQLTGPAPDHAWFRLRGELTQLGLVEGFDELLCLPALHGVEAHWYQIETVRKVLKQYRGRVLLADEVGLGKTIEAGMVLKEYILRGMAERVLILVPASLG